MRHLVSVELFQRGARSFQEALLSLRTLGHGVIQGPTNVMGAKRGGCPRAFQDGIQRNPVISLDPILEGPRAPTTLAPWVITPD